MSFFKKRLVNKTQFLGPKVWKYKPFFIDTPTEMGSEHPFPHKNLKFQWTIYSGRECNEFQNKNLVCVIFQLHLHLLFFFVILRGVSKFWDRYLGSINMNSNKKFALRVFDKFDSNLYVIDITHTENLFDTSNI